MKKVLFSIVAVLLCTSVSYANGPGNYVDYFAPLQPSSEKLVKPKDTGQNSHIDFGLYVKELQRRIKMNWDKPKDISFNRVVVELDIAKDGKLIQASVIKTSGNSRVDTSTLNAIKSASPFKPLPVGFVGESCKIQFTFDQNFLGATMVN